MEISELLNNICTTVDCKIACLKYKLSWRYYCFPSGCTPVNCDNYASGGKYSTLDTNGYNGFVYNDKLNYVFENSPNWGFEVLRLPFKLDNFDSTIYGGA